MGSDCREYTHAEDTAESLSTSRPVRQSMATSRKRTPDRWFLCVGLCAALVAQPVLQTPALSSHLLDAAGRGDVASVRDLLANGVDIESTNDRGATPLYVAAERGHLEVVRLLLAHGADPDTKDLEWGRTPLRHAGMGGAGAAAATRAEMLELLLETGAGTAGESLVDLIWSGRIDAVLTLVARDGVDPSLLNVAYETAVDYGLAELADTLRIAGGREPRPIDRLWSAKRRDLWVGIYQDAAGRSLTLAPSVHPDQLLLERPGQPSTALLPLDLLSFKSFDRTLLVSRSVGSVTPRELTLREAGIREVFARTSDPVPSANRAPAPPRAADNPVAGPAVASGEHWPSFRGTRSSGIALHAIPPTTWDLERSINVAWKTPIPGLAHSSPIVWDDRIFVTTAVAATDDPTTFRHGFDAYTFLDADNRSTTDREAHSWRIYALDRESGEILWERVAHEGIPRTARHVSQSQANSTPATDGAHLVVWFGSEGLYCYDMAGALLWSRDLGPLGSGYVVDPSYEWTTASSPVIYERLVILQVDLLADSFIAAFDIETGAEVWRTTRDEAPSWATPLIYEGPPRTELVTLAPNFARGYDPETGEELWRLGKHSIYAIPAPISGRGLIYLTSGSGGSVQPIYAVRPGGAGDITPADDATSSDHVVWSTHRGGAFIPTPILYGDVLYVSSDTGILAAYDDATGERLYRVRLSRGGTYSASPIAADGRLYFSSEDGDVIVVRAGREFEQLAVNTMDEIVMATPAAVDDMLIFRTQHHVVAVAERGQQP